MGTNVWSGTTDWQGQGVSDIVTVFWGGVFADKSMTGRKGPGAANNNVSVRQV